MKIGKFQIDLSGYIAPASAILMLAFLGLLGFFPGFCESALGIHDDAMLMLMVFDLACLSLYANRLRMHRLILRSFVGPFVIAFTVILFVLVLQFLTKYMEDIMGKGLEAMVLAKVVGLACITSVTLALPLGILLSSLLTMGNMGERYELAALKSSGVSLLKVIRPLMHATLVITVGSVFFSFHVTPMANLKLYTLLYDLSRVKPTFALKANHFYDGIDGMVVHVGDIDRETDILTAIKIFDHTDHQGNQRITLASHGRMVPSEAAGYLDMNLYNGEIFERESQEGRGPRRERIQVFNFDTLMYKVPLQGFNLENSNEESFSSHHYMLNIHELTVSIDSMQSHLNGYFSDYANFNRKYVHLDTTMSREMQALLAKDTVYYPASGVVRPDSAKPVWAWFPGLNPKDLLTKAVNQSKSLQNYTRMMIDRCEREDEKIRKFKIERQNRWMLPASCIIFLFLGASLGAIIRKGGIGVPVIFSILFFIIFYIFMIQGRKLARDEILPIWIGAWLPVLLMCPLAIFTTWQSVTESKLLYGVSWYKTVRFFLSVFPFMKRKQTKPDVLSVEERIAQREKSRGDALRAYEDYESNK